MAAATSVHVVAIVEPIIQHADWFFPEGEFCLRRVTAALTVNSFALRPHWEIPNSLPHVSVMLRPAVHRSAVTKCGERVIFVTHEFLESSHSAKRHNGSRACFLMKA